MRGSFFMTVPFISSVGLRWIVYNDRLLPVKSEMMNRTIKMKNRTLAIDAAAATILKNPKIPAINATTRKIRDHFNMAIIFPS